MHTPSQPSLTNLRPPPLLHRGSRRARLLTAWAALSICLSPWSAVQAQTATESPGHSAEFPTVDRVLYVQECMRNHPGPHYEMLNKCACVLDRLAAEVSFDDYLTMSTATNATTIGGERGGVIRDNEPLQQQIKRYRELQGRAKKACFIS